MVQRFWLTSVLRHWMELQKFPLPATHFRDACFPLSVACPSICIMARKQYCHLVGAQNVTFDSPPDLSA